MTQEPPATGTPSPGHGAPQVPPGEGPVLPGEGRTDYERYMKVDALLALQKPIPSLVHHDELLFQTVHQTFELWARQILFEIETAGELLARDRLLEAVRLFERATMAVRVVREQLHVLNTMNPWDFHEVRRHLGRGSGAESPGFQNLLKHAPRLWRPFADVLARRNVSLEDVYVHAARHPDLYRMAEAMTDFDEFFSLWRQDHLGLVKRQIGRDVKSLKGYAVHALEKDVQATLFPELWAVRNRLTELAGTSPE